MEKSYKSGDRYQCDYEGDIWEIVEGVEGINCICVDAGRNTHARVGEYGQYSFPLYNWKYLGNFSKSENFNNLYEKLSAISDRDNI